MNLKKAVLLCGCLLLVRAGSGSPSLPFLAEADDSSDPYKIIAERNVFHLNPTPIPPPPVPPKIELPTIKFSGWFRVGRVTKALFCTLPKDKKETPSYYDLCEGEKAGFLELVKIRYDQGEVDVINSGVAMTLSLKDDSLVSAPEKSGLRVGDNHNHLSPIHMLGQFQGESRGFPKSDANSSAMFSGRPRRSPVR